MAFPGPDLRAVRVDLHLHTVVSACAEIEMIPPLIVRRAAELGIEMLAVTDHNTVDNAEAVARAAEPFGIRVLPGMELQTREEAHMVCLFGDLDSALAWQEIVYAHLPQVANRPEVFGAQYVVDETGEYVRSNDRLLATSADLSVEDAVDGVRKLGGLPIAAHVDRPTNSILINLGFIPPGLDLAALDLSRNATPKRFMAEHPELANWPLVQSGDAHRLNEICGNTRLIVREPSFEELTRALRSKSGRGVEIV